MLIGITGKKRRGKDTAAECLVTGKRWHKHGYADKVKEMLYAINPIIQVTYDQSLLVGPAVFEVYKSSVEGKPSIGQIRLSDLIDSMGWENAKELREVRTLLQRLGTEGGRKIFGKDFWVDRLFEFLEKKYGWYYGDYKSKRIQTNLVISDVRFDNEARRIHAYGGYIIEITSTRPGLPEPDSHASEAGLSVNMLDYRIENNGTIEDLSKEVESVLNDIQESKRRLK